MFDFDVSKIGKRTFIHKLPKLLFFTEFYSEHVQNGFPSSQSKGLT